MSDASSPLRAALEAVIAEQGCSLKDLTVLATQNDPFRVDTPARHRDGEWLAITAQELGLDDRRIHLRGLHYMVIDRPKPDGAPYRNTEEEWLWLQGDAAKAARWLGYIPFDQIVDQRNAEPVVREFEPPVPGAYLSTELQVQIPYDITPTLYTDDFRGVQPYKLVMVGEKSSLEPVLSPIARDYEADLYLPTGEISDTLIYRMASTAKVDGRPMVVLYFADCDPSGWQMGISVARKLQAFRQLLGRFEFELHRVALTPDQVREHGLPSTPLKDTEKRADKWRQATGVEQTEIDALAALRPELLDQIARQVLDGFYDHTLGGRVERYRSEWLDRARDLITATFDMDRLDAIRRDAEGRLSEMRQEIRDLNDSLRIEVDEDDLPLIDLPEATDPGGNGLPLLDSRWPFTDQCRRLIDSKSYRTR
ncbi:MAG TPA: hypothetical protein VGQ26_29520 [Streptosporangiaceae bacterium]|nr:hypothetical protein [Streptosporangiaceae bacterium]